MCHLELDPLAADIGPAFAPVELERLAGLEHQWHIRAAPSRLFRPVPVGTPSPRKGRHASVGAVIAELDQIGVHLLHGAAFLARLARLHQQPGGQTIRIRVKLARSCRRLELRLNRTLAQIISDGVARQACAPWFLAIGILSRNAPSRQICHANSLFGSERRMILKIPCRSLQNSPTNSVRATCSYGSILSENLADHRVSFQRKSTVMASRFIG